MSSKRLRLSVTPVCNDSFDSPVCNDSLAFTQNAEKVWTNETYLGLVFEFLRVYEIVKNIMLINCQIANFLSNPEKSNYIFKRTLAYELQPTEFFLDYKNLFWLKKRKRCKPYLFIELNKFGYLLHI